MDILFKFTNYIQHTFKQSSLGLTLIEIILILIAFFLALVLRGFFAKLLVSKIKKIIKKTGNKVDDSLFDTLAPPLKTLPIIFVFILVGLFINKSSQLGLVLEKINQTLVTIFIFWLLHQSLVPLSQVFQKLDELLSKALVLWLLRSLKYLIIFFKDNNLIFNLITIIIMINNIVSRVNEDFCLS